MGYASWDKILYFLKLFYSNSFCFILKNVFKVFELLLLIGAVIFQWRYKMLQKNNDYQEKVKKVLKHECVYNLTWNLFYIVVDRNL